MSIDQELQSLYFEETKEHLDRVNECLLELETDLGNMEYIHDIFRSVHTIKSSTAAMGFTNTAELIHRLEDLMQYVRDGKAKLDEKTLQLLFIAHDYLDEFISKMVSGIDESTLNSAHIYEELCNMIKAAETQQDDSEAVQMTGGIGLSEAMLKQIKKGIEDGETLYGVCIKIDHDCAFKAVRTLICLNEVERLAQMIDTYPMKSKLEDMSNSSEFGENELIDILLLSKKQEVDLSNDLHNKLIEFDWIYVEKLEFGDTGLMGNVVGINPNDGKHYFNHMAIELLQIDLQNPDKVIEQGTMNVFSPEFMNEILIDIKEAEVTFLELKLGEFSMTVINDLFKHFHHISALALYIEHELLFRVSKKTERFLETIKKWRLQANDQMFNLLASSLLLVGKICRSPEEQHSTEVEKHCELLKANIVLYNSAAISESKINEGIGSEKKLGEILIEKGKLTPEEMDQAINLQKTVYNNLKIGQVLVKEESVAIGDIKDAIVSQEIARKESKNVNYIRVAEQKIDSMFELLGELIIIQSQQKEDISNVLIEGDISKLSNKVSRMERIVRDLQDITMTLRMVSVKQTFQKILRIGRDTAKELKKNVNLDVSGEDVEVDRVIVDRLSDPLMHLIRNSIGHGIEKNPQDRVSAGKPEVGNVKLSASSRKGNVYIEIADDGGGIDIEKVLKKAQEVGLAKKDKEYTENEIINFILLPGFSTQSIIDSISGRGVGLNVVDSEIRKAGGKLEIKTQKGKGSTFILKIPINLATMTGITVGINQQKYVLASTSIKKIFKPEESEWVYVKEKIEMVKNRGELYKVLKTHEIMEHQESYENNIIILLEHEGNFRALPVNEIVGKQEVVIKPLDNKFAHLGFLSGSTILGDGCAAFILDVEYFFR